MRDHAMVLICDERGHVSHPTAFKMRGASVACTGATVEATLVLCQLGKYDE